MDHRVPMPPELLRQAHADGQRPREAAAAEPCWRSEAFAEDLYGDDSAAPKVVLPRGVAGWLLAAPLGMALAGVVLTLFGPTA